MGVPGEHAHKFRRAPNGAWQRKRSDEKVWRTMYLDKSVPGEITTVWR